MPSMHFCSGDEADFVTADSCPTTSTRRALVCGSIPFLVEARLHLVRRTDWPDRHHADRVGREEEMDQSIAFSARVKLLHAPAWTGGAATGDLYRLAFAQDLGRHRCW